jgi:F-type H+-transporting ATPase subunit gamma
VIAQRLVVEQLLPVERIGEPAIADAQEMELEQKRRVVEAAKGSGVGLKPKDTQEIDEHAAQFAAASVDYIYEQPPQQFVPVVAPKYVSIQIFHGLLESVAAGACGAHDGDGVRYQQRQRHD